MGQERPVQVFLLVTEQTIEENLLATLAVKHELAEAVLDPDSDVDALDMFGRPEELRQRLEVLLGARPAAGVDEREREGREREIEAAARRERLAVAGGALVGAAFSFLGELLPAREPAPESAHLAERFRRQLAECIEEDESGRPTLRLKLPDRSALDGLARSLGRLLAEHGGGCCLWRGGPTVSARRDGGVG